MKELPVVESVKDAVGYTFTNINLLAKASMLWVLAYTIILSIFLLQGGEEYFELTRESQGLLMELINDPKGAMAKVEAYQLREGILLEKLGYAYSVFMVLNFAVVVGATYSIAISWHRACLLDETPPLLRFGKLELKYLGYSILVALIVMLFSMLASVGVGVVFVILSLVSGGGVSPTSVVILYIAMAAIIGMLYGRFNLVFPGIAVRDRRMGLKVSWKATKGNSWRIFAGTLLSFIPAIVVTLIYMLLNSVSLPVIILHPLLMVLQLLAGAFLLSFMSICYQFLVPSPDEGDLA